MAAEEWIRVKKTRPCPICGRPDWCLIARNGWAVICPRISQGAVGQTQGGYLHRGDYRKEAAQ